MRHAAIVIGALCCAAPSVARADVRLGLGADWWRDSRNGFLSLTLAVDGPLARYLHVGGRFGALVTGSPNTFGAPIDFFLRAHLGEGRVYLEGLFGPWLFFYPYEMVLRFHGAFGFGLRSGGLLFGLEVGWVDVPHAGLRLGFQI